MGFDPDAYLKAKTVGAELGSFDPDSYLATKSQSEKSSPVMTGIRQAAQGFTAGFSDELAGGIEAVGRAAGFEGAGGPIKDIKQAASGPTLDWEILRDAYRRATTKEREAIKKDLKENPKTAIASGLASAVVSPINKILPNASLAKSGAAVGATVGLGTSESDTVLGTAGDVVAGAALGGAFGKLTDEAAPYIEKATDAVVTPLKKLKERVGKEFGDFAADRSAAAQGYTKAMRKKIGNEKALAQGRAGLDKGIVTAGASPEKMLGRAKELESRGGKMMGDVYDAIDEKAASTFNPLDAATKFDEKSGGFWRSPLNKSETNQFENTLEAILQRGDKPIPMREAQKLKEEVGKAANFDKPKHLEVTPKEQIARDAYKIINKGIDDAASAGVKSVGVEGLGESLKRGKDLFQVGNYARKGLNERISQKGNNFFGLTDYIAGAGSVGYGASTGDWETAVGLMAAKKVGQKYGNQVMAASSDAISKRLMQSPRFVAMAKESPQAFRGLVLKLEREFSGLSGMKKSADTSPVNKQPDQEIAAPLKGKEKWASDGFEKLQKHKPNSTLDKGAMLSDPKIKDLLIQASDLKPGSQAMNKILARIENRNSKGQN